MGLTPKRISDATVSLLALVVLCLPLVSIAFLILIDSPGPVFFRGRRVGFDGKPFRIFKFRTMIVNAEKLGGSSTADNDPRITRIGRVLRKFKLDELPQFLNVLVGDMSLVGPRPEVQYYVDMYTDEEKAILRVKPGITDWASLWNSDEGAVLAGSPDPERAYMERIRPQKIRLQLEYVRNRSFWGDIKILLWTLWSVVVRVFGGSFRWSCKRESTRD